MKSAFAIVALISLLPLSPASAEPARTWKTLDGKAVQASAVAFNFDTKMVTLESGENSQAQYSTKDLDFSSRRMLFFSPVFQNSQSSGSSTGIWRKERIFYWALLIFGSVFLLILGMWLSGLFIARRFNPFSSIGAFLGSWLAGAILMVCYLLFAAKTGTGGGGLIWFGGLIAMVVVAMFVSAIYRTSFLKGLFIFIGHLAFAGLLGYVLVFGSDTFFPDQTSEFWERWVFVPTGLVEGFREGY